MARSLIISPGWQQTPDEKMTYQQAVDRAGSIKLDGYADWRLPMIKE